jgi:integrase
MILRWARFPLRRCSGKRPWPSASPTNTRSRTAASLSKNHVYDHLVNSLWALSPQELGRVLGTARESNREFRGLRGVDRFHLYLTASGTGFRVGELATLTRSSFALDANSPTVTVGSAYTKNKKIAVQPVPAEVVEAMRDYLASPPAVGLPWPGGWTVDAAEMLRIDLEAADIPYAVEGPDGPEFADFNAPRHSYVALLDRAGLTLKQAM